MKREDIENIDEYSGLNKLFKSKYVQTMKNKVDDGTFSEFIEDWTWIFSYSKKYKWIIVLYTVLGIASASLSLISAWVSRILINIVVGKQYSNLWMLAVTMLVTSIISIVFSSVNSRISTKISIFVNNDIQAEIFDKIMDANWSSINEYSNGDLLNRFNNDISTIATNAISWIPNIIINIYTFLVTFILLFKLDIIMSLIALLSAPFLLLVSRYIMRKMRMYRKRVLEMNSNMMSFESETFYNYDTIKSFGISKHYSKSLRNWQEKYKEYNLDYNMFQIKSNIMMTCLSTFVSFVAFGYCIYKLYKGQIQFGDMEFFLTQRSKLSSNFNTLVSTIPNMLNSAISAHRIKELVDLPKEVHNDTELEELESIASEGLTIELDDVSFAYKEGNNVYENSKFIAKPNEIVAVVGSSGEGKTTMLRMILGLIYPDTGHAHLYGKDGKKIDMNADLRSMFAYVPQGNTIIAGTIADNLRMVKEDASDDEVIEALKISCAFEFVSQFSDTINHKLGEKGKGVSEGQAQRIAIARAVLRNSPILLLDEATSALDVETERQVLYNIVKQRPNKTIIVSTHRPSVLNQCQRIYKIIHKEIRELNESETKSLIREYYE